MRRCLQGEGIVDVYHFSIKKSNIYPMHTHTHTVLLTQLMYRMITYQKWMISGSSSKQLLHWIQGTAFGANMWVAMEAELMSFLLFLPNRS